MKRAKTIPEHFYLKSKLINQLIIQYNTNYIRSKPLDEEKMV